MIEQKNWVVSVVGAAILFQNVILKSACPCPQLLEGWWLDFLFEFSGNSWQPKKASLPKGIPIPGGNYIQWCEDVVHPPCFRAGQLWCAIPVSHFLEGSWVPWQQHDSWILSPFLHRYFWEHCLTSTHRDLSVLESVPSLRICPNLQQWLFL